MYVREQLGAGLTHTQQDKYFLIVHRIVRYFFDMNTRIGNLRNRSKPFIACYKNLLRFSSNNLLPSALGRESITHTFANT